MQLHVMGLIRNKAVRLLLSSSELPSSGETIHEFVLHLSTHWADRKSVV